MSRLDRRALFTSGAAAALLAATGVSLEAAPRRGGRLRLAVPRMDARFKMALRGAVYDTLTEVGPDGLLRGELALSWDSDTHARDWVLQLRPGVTFHDGQAFAAEDARRSLSGFGAAGIEVAGDHSLRIHLDASNPQLPYLLADPDLVMRPGGRWGEMPVGTGLYKAQRYQDDRHFLGQRVKPHYKDGQAGWFDSVEIAVIPDAAVRAEALRDGFVDVADLPQAASLGDTAALFLHPDAKALELAARQGVGVPRQIGTRSALDDGRIAQRWWMA
ncbi:ABC transporter substrate-binding protein [Aestuariivita sp.]|jgi:ABC-type transport system substrate-binding protein|uniref:ABC transporter substrate-binding protein n=1 Tax=Aestuariivita sp. TaxID=1872407 RepID=UPI00217205B7|nr:ABC transporter substrate-binding protein [Aestuariivita sp.]MCE8005473.1 peptide ABC transporter substrate-binding protein [Aestuariivita sp.]